MALIGSLRDKMGTWVVVFVFVAIAAFILGDIFSGNSNIMNWGRKSVGEIAGKDISIDEYQAAVLEREQAFMASNGYEPSDRDKASLRQQAWDLLIARHAIVPQYEKVGVEVTQKELVDMISGKNIFEGIKQAFTNQQTGEFDRNQLGTYINQIKDLPADNQMKARWNQFQADLIPARERIKYENLLLKTNYVTKAEAEREYHLQSDVAEVKYLYVPYYTVSDSSEVTDAELQDYYNKNKERFKTKGTKDLKYVVIPVTPSAADSAAVKEDLAKDVEAFKTSQQDSAYAATNTDGQNPYTKYNRGNLPAFIKETDLVEGNVIGPVVDGETYRVVKISKISTDTVSSARASHILIRTTDASDTAKVSAKAKARKILSDIKAGADFAAKAREFSADPSNAQNGGDLGWFASGRMVKSFDDAVFSATKPGLVNDVVETDYGYHIIKVTEAKTNTAYNIAVIERQILPSDETINEAFRRAEAFADDLSGVSEFEQRAKQQGFTVLDAKNIAAGDRRVGALGDARPVVQWLYRDASVGKVSEIFELQDQHVVAVMTNEIEEGYKPLADVKAEITPAVRNEKSAKVIIEKLKKLNGSLEEIAKGYGPDANIYTSSDVKLNSNALPSAGYDPKAIGVAFSIESGKRSVPLQGENGVIIVETLNKTVAPDLNDYSSFKGPLEQSALNLSSMNIAEAIKDQSDIEDERYKFY
jgi:peptidyl-prolyl cis-trans isomerase D